MTVLDLAGTCSGNGPCDTTPIGTGRNWVTKAGGLDPYTRAIAHALIRKGMPESKAIAIAIAAKRKWLAGKATAGTKARAAKSEGDWEALKARSHSHTAEDVPSIDLAAPLRAKTGKFATNNHPRRQAVMAPSMTADQIKKAFANLNKVPVGLRPATKARLMAKAKAMNIDLANTTYPGTSKFPVNTQAQFEAACRLYGNSTLPKDKVKAWLIGVGKRNGWPVPAAWKP